MGSPGAHSGSEKESLKGLKALIPSYFNKYDPINHTIDHHISKFCAAKSTMMIVTKS